MNKKHLALLLILCVAAFILRVIAIRIPMSPWWDPAIYVGMAKFIFSGGAMGMWETLRPPLWPIMLGIPWAVGINPLVAAQYIVALSCIATFVALFVLGEKEERGIGLAAALILALSPIYTFFVAIPTNDIPSALIALIASYSVLRRRYFTAGIFTALAFLMRFPHGLFLVPFGLFILIEAAQQKSLKKFIIDSFKHVGFLALGFATLAVPYFILNQIFFGDPLLPIKLGRNVIEGNPDQSFWYYVKNAVIDNPMLVLSFLGVAAFIIKVIKYRKLPASAITLSVLCTLVIGWYMSHIGHKELRYSFGFIPYVALLTGYGLSVIWNQSQWRHAKYIALAVVLVLGGVNVWTQANHNYIVPLSHERADYYKAIPAPSTTITSSPQVMLYSDTKITGVFASWEGAIDMIKAQKDTLEYVALDEQQVFCPKTSCLDAKTAFINAVMSVSPKAQVVYEAYDGAIHLAVYKLR
jgi:hypothetical protein